jgi:cullin 3
VTVHLASVISKTNSGLDVMIDLNQLDDLTRLFRIAVMVPTGLPCLKAALKASIGRRGGEINRASLGTENEEAEEGVVDVGGSASNPRKAKAQQNSSVQILALALQWVQEVVDLKDRFDRILVEAFSRNRELVSAVDNVRPYHNTLGTGTRNDEHQQAFESFINLNDRSPEFISLFIDENLKKGLKGVRLKLLSQRGD